MGDYKTPQTKVSAVSKTFQKVETNPINGVTSLEPNSLVKFPKLDSLGKFYSARNPAGIRNYQDCC